ncbi:hypothetical protein [Sphingomonas sp. PAMC 26605]|uniref:hypothetical protein n=1 Tax=Sphingomonas sp. PAMC 26605 TaxID=1112214 RepID=UPI000683DA25|nr:hypothetical protein [Sphingomonas sp. PAMC 26605]
MPVTSIPTATRRLVPHRAGPALVIVVMLVALLARMVTFGDPVIQVDEEFYYVNAHAMWRGALPYVDIWDRKPIGLFLLYMPAAWLPLRWGVLAYQALATLSLILTALTVAQLARRAAWGAGALAAALAYVLWPNLLNGVGGQSPIFYNLPMAVAAALIVAAGDRRRRRALGCGAMALVGVALQIKYSAVFEGIFFGLWLLAQEWRARHSPLALLSYGAGLVALSLAPTAVALGYYTSIGQADAFVFANFLSIAHRNADPAAEMIRNGGTLVLLLSPLVAMAFGAPAEVREVRIGGDGAARRFLFAWFAVAVLGVIVFGTWFDHYGLPVLVPGCACAAGFFANPRFGRRIGPAILILVALVGQIVVLVNLRARGDAATFAALSRAVGRGPGCLYVYSGTTMLYAGTGRCRVSRYVVPAHLNRARENGATGVEQAREVRRILALHPAVVVMRPPFSGERSDIRHIVGAAMARAYRVVAVRPMGHELITVYKRRDRPNS